MLHIILLILQAIGIILVSILGVILFLLLLVLIVPIRYQMTARKYEEIQLSAKISWLLNIIHCKVTYEKDAVAYVVSVFGWPIIDSNRPPNAKSKKKKRKRRKKQGKNPRKKQKTDVTLSKRPLDGTNKMEESHSVKPESVEENYAIEEKEKTKKHMDAHTKTVETDSGNQEVAREKFTDVSQIGRKQSVWKKLRGWISRRVERLKKLAHAVRNSIYQVVNYIRSFIPNLKKKVKNLIEKKDDIVRKVTVLKNFWQDPYNKIAFKRVWKSIKQLLVHIKPRKLKGFVRYGTGNPSSTGQILGGLSIAYPLYGKYIKVSPDFLEEVIEGDLYLAGRIRVITLLLISIRLILNKEFKQLRKRFQTLKEEL